MMNKKILIIEDEKDLRELLEEELSGAGYEVIEASNGLEGLALLQDTNPDLIICDRVMPAMTGYELLERIRGVYPQYRHTPFLFLTALTDKRDRDAVEQLNPHAYLEKPIDFDVLLSTVEKFID